MYAEEVLKIMDRLVDVLKANHSVGLESETQRHIASASVPGKDMTTFMRIPTLVSLVDPTSKGTFSTRLKALEGYRWLWSR